MSGCRLKEMPLNEMLDVLHVLFEDDMTPSWEADLEVKSRARKAIYQSWYKREYLYGLGETQSSELDDPFTHDYSGEVDGPVKPYIPPTPMEDLQGIVGAPMGE